MSARCPRCGGHVDSGLFPICTRCGAAASSRAWPAGGPSDPSASRPALAGSVFAGRDAAGRPQGAHTVARLLVGLIVLIIVAGAGLALFRAERDGTKASSAATAPAPETSVQAAASEPATSAGGGATSAPAASTASAPAVAATEDACARRWNGRANAATRQVLANLGVQTAQIRPGAKGCVLLARTPGQGTTRFLERSGVFVVAGTTDVAPAANARLDARGRLVLV